MPHAPLYMQTAQTRHDLLQTAAREAPSDILSQYLLKFCSYYLQPSLLIDKVSFRIVMRGLLSPHRQRSPLPALWQRFSQPRISIETRNCCISPLTYTLSCTELTDLLSLVTPLSRNPSRGLHIVAAKAEYLMIIMSPIIPHPTVFSMSIKASCTKFCRKAWHCVARQQMIASCTTMSFLKAELFPYVSISSHFLPSKFQIA